MVKEALLRVAVSQGLNPVQHAIVKRLMRADRAAEKTYARLLALRDKYGPGHQDDLSIYVDDAKNDMARAYGELKDFCDSLDEAHHARH